MEKKFKIENGVLTFRYASPECIGRVIALLQVSKEVAETVKIVQCVTLDYIAKEQLDEVMKFTPNATKGFILEKERSPEYMKELERETQHMEKVITVKPLPAPLYKTKASGKVLQTT